MKKHLLTLLVVALATASAMAATTATGTNAVSPTLVINATVQSAVRLTLSTGTALITNCPVNAGGGGDYNMNFGTVDALGINAGNCSLLAPPVPGTDPATYYSSYNLTATFTGQSTTNNTITEKVTTNFTAADLAVVRDTNNSATVPAVLADFTPVSTGTPDTIVTNAVKNTPVTRFIGVQVSPTNGAGTLTGAQSATVTFTLTVQ